MADRNTTIPDKRSRRVRGLTQAPSPPSPVSGGSSTSILSAKTEAAIERAKRARAAALAPIADMKSRAELEQEVQRLREQLAAIKNETIATGERTTLYKLGAYLARRFGYIEAHRNDATGKVKNELQRQGVNMDDKTIRKLMKQGVKHFPRDP